SRAVMTVRNMNRFVFAPWGFRGGEQGCLGQTVVNPGTPNERSIGKISVLELEAGDVVRITSPCGGGFGNPLERDLGDIADEIKSGMLSRERAEEVYAVAFGADGDIDVTETAARRRVKVNDTPAEFNFCSERKRHDS